MLTLDQLRARQSGIGSSDIAVIAGVSSYGSELQVYRDKVCEPTLDEPTEAQWWGSEMESLLCRRYEMVTGRRCWLTDKMFRHPDHPIATSHPDAFAWESLLDGPHRCVEIKTAWSWKQQARWTKTEVPDEYYCQSTWHWGITGLPVDLFVLMPGKYGPETYLYELKPDPELFEALLTKAVSWWERHIVAGIAPEPDDSAEDGRALADIWPEDDADIRLTRDEEEVELIEAAVRAKAAVAAAKSEYESLKNRVKAAAANCEGIETPDGELRATWKQDARGKRRWRIT